MEFLEACFCGGSRHLIHLHNPVPEFCRATGTTAAEEVYKRKKKVLKWGNTMMLC